MNQLTSNNFFDIAVHTPFNDLLLLCRTNKQFATICDDNYFWKVKTKLDFPNIIPLTYNGIDQYLSAMYIDQIDSRKYRGLQEKLRKAVENNKIRLTTILLPIVLHYFKLNKSLLYFNEWLYLIGLCELAIESNNLAILIYLVNLAHRVIPSEFTKFSNSLVVTAIHENYLPIIKYIVEYNRKIDPNYKLPSHVYDAAIKFSKNIEITNYIKNSSDDPSDRVYPRMNFL